MQQYKSSKNVEVDRKFAKKMERQNGEMPFEIAPNKSGRINQKFVKEYTELPFILITPILPEDNAFDVTVTVTGRTKTDFTVNIQNLSSTETVKGTIVWKSE
jgi:hypothetical protein